jgi:hypothetical protein
MLLSYYLDRNDEGPLVDHFVGQDFAADDDLVTLGDRSLGTCLSSTESWFSSLVDTVIHKLHVK